MNIQYIGLKKIDGPLIVLDHVKDIGFEEVAELRLSDGTCLLYTSPSPRDRG